jgi:hypothetical protein
MAAARLYQASDLLWKHREALEVHLYGAEQSLFDFENTITLYDLTNTYFEREARGNSLAQRGHSKEKHSDCPLVTLGLVLDGNGFPPWVRATQEQLPRRRKLCRPTLVSQPVVGILARSQSLGARGRHYRGTLALNSQFQQNTSR